MAIQPQSPDADDDDMGMEVDQDGDESSTGLLPTSFFQGKELKPGTVCKVRIEKVLDGQVQVSYVPHNETSPAPGEEPEEPDDAEMSGYMNL